MTLFDILINKIASESLKTHSDVDILFMTLWGPPGSGKTTTMFTISSILVKLIEDVTVYHTMLIQDVLNYMQMHGAPPTRTIILLVDDAEYYRYSRTPSKAVREIQNHDMIRHRFKEAGWRHGYIFLIYATQWIMNLASVFRIAYAVGSKPTPLLDERERKVFIDIFGGAAEFKMKELWRKHFWHKAADDWKSLTLLKLAGYAAQPVILPPIPLQDYIDLWSTRMKLREEEERGKTKKVMEAAIFIQELLHEGKLPIWRTRNNRYYPYVTKELLRKYGYEEVKLAELEKALQAKLPVKRKEIWDGKTKKAIVILKPLEPSLVS